MYLNRRALDQTIDHLTYTTSDFLESRRLNRPRTNPDKGGVLFCTRTEDERFPIVVPFNKQNALDGNIWVPNTVTLGRCQSHSLVHSHDSIMNLNAGQEKWMANSFVTWKLQMV